MNRRNFVAGLAVAVAGIGAWRVLGSSREGAVARVLHKKLHYLQLDPAGVGQFARDFVQRGYISNAKLRGLDALGPLYGAFALDGHGKYTAGLQHGEDRVITEFLISSDFFRNGADATQVVHYVGYFDPMVACGNPFARPVEA